MQVIYVMLVLALASKAQLSTIVSRPESTEIIYDEEPDFSILFKYDETTSSTESSLVLRSKETKVDQNDSKDEEDCIPYPEGEPIYSFQYRFKYCDPPDTSTEPDSHQATTPRQDLKPGQNNIVTTTTNIGLKSTTPGKGNFGLSTPGTSSPITGTPAPIGQKPTTPGPSDFGPGTPGSLSGLNPSIPSTTPGNQSPIFSTLPSVTPRPNSTPSSQHGSTNAPISSLGVTPIYQSGGSPNISPLLPGVPVYQGSIPQNNPGGSIFQGIRPLVSPNTYPYPYPGVSATYPGTGPFGNSGPFQTRPGTRPIYHGNFPNMHPGNGPFRQIGVPQMRPGTGPFFQPGVSSMAPGNVHFPQRGVPPMRPGVGPFIQTGVPIMVPGNRPYVYGGMPFVPPGPIPAMHPGPFPTGGMRPMHPGGFRSCMPQQPGGGTYRYGSSIVIDAWPFCHGSVSPLIINTRPLGYLN